MSCLTYMGMAVGEVVSRRVMFGVVIGKVGSAGMPIVSELLEAMPNHLSMSLDDCVVDET